MNEIRRIEPGALMSQATVLGDIAFLAGQIGAEGPHDSFEAEARAALDAADRVLACVPSHRGALLHVTVHIYDLDLMPRFNIVWQDWLKGIDPPARVAVQTRMVDPAFHVAVSCIAAVTTADGGAE